MIRAWAWVRRRPLTTAIVVLVFLVGAGGFAWQRWRTDQLLVRGEEALAARDYPQAREHLAKYLEARPTDVRGRLLAARVARRLKDYDEAAEHLKRCQADGGDSEAIGIEFALIDVQRGNEGPGAALRRRALQDDELGLAVLEVLIQFDLDTYRLYQAREGLTLYLSRRPDDLQALLGRAYVWERFLYFADARNDYRKAVAAHPNNETARLKLADVLLITDSPADALEHYEWLAERWPERLEVRLGLAKCQRRLNQPAEAQRLLDRLLADVPSHGEALWERGQLEMDRDRLAEAETWLRRAYEAAPHDRRINYSLYRCLLSLGRKDAEAFNDRVKQIDADLSRLDQLRYQVMSRPDDAALRCEGGLIFLRNGERNEGVRWLQIALRADPKCEAARDALVNAGVMPRQ